MVTQAPGAVRLRARDLEMVFNAGEPDAVTAFHGISFDLHDGEILALVGPSGCGKSTLFNVIAGLLVPSRGTVEVEGRPVTRATGHVGYMLQKDLLLPWRSVEDNVALGLELRGMPAAQRLAEARALIRAYGLAGFEKARPGTLSGGMRQRAAFMRTLAPDPRVILLDEPFSALDFQTRVLLQAEFVRIIHEKRKSAILVTHDISEAVAMADRVIVLTSRPGTIRSTHVIDMPRGERGHIMFDAPPEARRVARAIWDDLDIATVQ